MGLYDREYVRGREPGFFLGGGDRSAVTDLILVNVAVFLLDMFFDGRLDNMFALSADVLSQPWRAYELLTYGFVHDPRSLMHIAFNMFSLWLFGRDIEAIYGRNEFLRIYLSMIVFGGVVWVAIRWIGLVPFGPPVVGASGAVVGVMVLYAMHYPHRILLVFGIFPAPAWAVCAFFIAGDLLGFGGRDVAHEVHLAGAAFAFLYRKGRWNLGSVYTSSTWMRKLRSLTRPRLHVHQPRPDEPENEVSRSDQVDRILEKISREGEASLTREERRILEDASRRYQQRRH